MRDIEFVINIKFITKGDIIMFTIFTYVAIGYCVTHIISVVTNEIKKENKREKKLNDGWIDCRAL